MEVKATLTRDWKKRWLILTGFVFAGALWFYYDGFIGYPKMAKHYQEYRQFADNIISSGKAKTDSDRAVKDAWREYSIQNGWKIETPKNKTESHFSKQKNYGTFLVGVSLLLFGWYYYSTRQSVLFDGTTITAVNGSTVKKDEVFKLDKRKWENKGIVYAHYEQSGQKKKIALDAYKFGDEVEQIIEILEKNLEHKS